MKEVFILFVYEDYETYIDNVYSTYTAAYERKKELLEGRYNRSDGVTDVDIITKSVLS